MDKYKVLYGFRPSRSKYKDRRRYQKWNKTHRNRSIHRGRSKRVKLESNSSEKTKNVRDNNNAY